MAPRKRPNLKQGIQVERITLAPGTTKRFDFPVPNLINCTIRIENSTQLSNSTVLKIYFENYDTHNVTYYTLTPDRYGVYIDNKPLDYIIFENLSPNLYIDVYFEYLLKEYFEPYEEAIQFITVIQTLPPPPSNQLFQGTNNRYTGTLSNATFLQSVPIGTPMAVRVINSISTSTTSVGIIEIPLAANLTYHADIAPASYAVYGQAQTGEIIVFNADSITNQLPASATQSNATVQDFIIDYAFDFHMQVNFSNTYTITTSGSTTYINYNGDVFLYYYDNTSLPLANANVSSITQSNTQYTLSPTSGTTNGNGQVPVTVSEVLNSTTTLPSNTITASTTIAGISRSASATITPSFDFNITSSDNGYTITTSGTTTYINDSGTFTLTTTTGLALPNQTVSITQSNTNYNLTAATSTNSNGVVDFSVSQILNSTTTLDDTLTASSTVANINKSSNLTLATGKFNFNLSQLSFTLPNIIESTTQFTNSASAAENCNSSTGSATITCNNANDYVVIMCSAGYTPSVSPSVTLTNLGNGVFYFQAPSAGSYTISISAGQFVQGYITVIDSTKVTLQYTYQTKSTSLSISYTPTTNYAIQLAFVIANGLSQVISYYTGLSISQTSPSSATILFNQGFSSTDVGCFGSNSAGLASMLSYSNTIQTFSYNVTLGTAENFGNIILTFFGFYLNQITPSTTITATYQNQSIPNQTVTFTITGSGPASFSSSSTVTSTTVTTNSNGQATVTVYKADNANTLTASCTIAGITQSSSITV